MKTIVRALLLSLSLLSLAGLSAPASHAAPQPFDFTFSGAPELIPTDNPCIMRGAPTAVGTSSFGPVTFQAEEVINYCHVPTDVTSSFTLTFDDGSTVYGTIYARMTLNLRGIAIHYAGTYTLEGGTGDFAGATGTGSCKVTFPLTSLPIIATVVGSGTIDF